ncbi:MAG: AAA family ATPase, partial [Archangium sp.]|nr:AAA family ATPase [Archangium sp.]
LVPLHELGREDDTWFLVMEVIDGLDLLAALKERPQLVRPVFAQIALGLSFLHASGRIHRDLKPSNVRVTPAGHAVVLDFGLAIDGAPDASEGMVGAAAWISPEQASGAAATPASDLYALGVMLHEALAGKRPFEGPALEVLSAKRARDAVVELPGVDEALRSLCARMLSREPAARPTAPEVVAALDTTLVPLLAQRPEAPLLGRETLLAALEGAAAQPRATAVWLQGAPGLGKSALLRHFLDAQTHAGALVLSSRCFEHESTPFKAVDGLIDGLTRWLARRRGPPLSDAARTHAANLARSFPALRGVVEGTPSSSPPERHRREAAVAFRELIALATNERRLVLAIDDLHWADADSIPFLTELLDTREPPPVLFVGALRDEGHPLLEPLRVEPAPAGCAERRHLAVTPLGESASAALAKTLMPERGDVTTLLRSAAGSPFLLHALAGHEGELEDAVSKRVASLPEAARRLLELVALAGAPLERRTWIPAAQLEQQDALALGHLRANRMVRVRRDGTLEPYHDTLRRAVVAKIADAHRRTQHARLADALSAAEADPELLAMHLHAADRLDEAATQAFRGAERAMAALAYNHAAALFAKGLTWAPRRGDARTQRVKWGHALANAGRGEDAARAFLESCEGANAAESLELRTRAGAQLLRSGMLERGLELTRETLEARGLSLARTPRGAIASMVWSRARLFFRGYEFKPRPVESLPAGELARVDALTQTSIGLAAVDSLRAADLMSQALLRALALGDSRRIAICLGYETAFAGNAGGAGEKRTRQVLEACNRVAAALEDPYAQACALGGAGIAHFHLGLLRDAQSLCEQSAAKFERYPGAVKEYFTEQLFALAALAQSGQLAEVARRLTSHLPLAIERGDRYVESTLRSGLPNLAWLAGDDEMRARRELALAAPGLITAGYSVQHFFEFFGRFNVEAYAGDVEGAQRVLNEGLPLLQASLLKRTEWIAMQISWMQGRIAAMTKRHAEVLPFAKQLEARKRPWGEALAMTLRAVAARDPALLDKAASLAEAAELQLNALSCAYVAAKWREDESGMSKAAQRASALGVVRLAAMARVYVPSLD